MKALFDFFDTDRNGYICISEFITGFRGQLEDERRRVIRQVWESLTATQESLSIDQLLICYQEDNVDEEFSKVIYQMDLNNDRVVTYDEWLEYYANLQGNFDTTEEFSRFIKLAWAPVRAITNNLQVEAREERRKIVRSVWTSLIADRESIGIDHLKVYF